MPSYFLEAYSADGDVSEARRRARRAAELERGVRYLRTTFLPAEETLFHVFEAPSREALVEAARRAGLPDARVTEALESEDEAVSWEGLHQRMQREAAPIAEADGVEARTAIDNRRRKA